MSKWGSIMWRIGAAAICAAVVSMAGCGGGGGKHAVSDAFGRSFLLQTATQTVAMTIDTSGRYTIVAIDSAALPGGASAQGTVSSGTGAFSGTSAAGGITFSGTVLAAGPAITGQVSHGGTLIIAFTAMLASGSGVTPGTLGGTYSGASGTASAQIAVDAIGHLALWASTGAASGGGLATVQSDGTFQSSAGDLKGTLTNGSSGYVVALTRLGGAVVSQSIPLNKLSAARWTILVFLNAANDLQSYAPLNVNQMEDVGSSSNVNIVVQWKQASCASCGSPSWTGTRRYLITQDNDRNQVSSKLIQDLGSGVDMGDWRVLKSFVQWGQANYPADRTVLVLWDHGAGWRPTRAAGAAPTYRSVSIDSATNNEIQTWEIPQALDVTPMVDMVVFDASLMQMAEVLYEMRNSTRLVVGSEESPPGEGYFYNTWLADLAANPNMTLQNFGSQIVTRTLEDYGPHLDNTQSMVDMAQMESVAGAMATFGSALQRHIVDEKAALTYARVNVQSYKYPENKDLWHYADLIRTQASAADLKSTAASLQTAIEASVLKEAHGSLRANSHGLAAYVPDPGTYLASYANLALSRRSPSWPAWLQLTP